jgi:hypothetical protein
MADWLITYGSWCLAPFGLLGMYVVGLKKRWGWMLGMTTQVLWATYAVGTAQYGFLLGTCAYFAVYLKNWLGWRRTAAGPAQAWMQRMIDEGRCDEVAHAYDDSRQGAAITALGAVYADLDRTGRAGDEWAYEWVHEVWPALVPRDIRIAVGDRDAAEGGS